MSTLWGSVFGALQAQVSPGPAPTPITPEALKALTELIKASGGSVTKVDYWWSVERINALTSAFGAIAWPVTVLIVAFVFRKPLIAFLSQVNEFEFAGAKIKKNLQENLQEAGEAAKLTAPFEPPTAAERERAAKVEQLLEGQLSVIRQEAEALAFEYERIRASLPPGNERTQEMEKVVAKMRTIGRAAYPIRHELAASPSPGKRLQAIAALQVIPDFDMLDWLAKRVSVEKPFVAYHALVALDLAAKDPGAAIHRAAIRNALKIALSAKEFFAEDTDRMKLLRSFEEAVARLPP
jgi:hypothetical protein